MSPGDGLPHVGVLIDTSTGWGRRLVRGVMNYARKHGPWRLWFEPHGRRDELDLPRGWAGDGLICRVTSPAVARKLQRYGVPIVNVSGVKLQGRAATLPRVTTDPTAAVQLAVDHFLDRGFKRFGYVGLGRGSYVVDHFQAYSAVLATRGYTCELFALPPQAAGWRVQGAVLTRWLEKLPKPVAVLTYALHGVSVLDACRLANLRVPEDVAVLGGDHDTLFCEAATPPLSGIETPSEAIGHEAARVLGLLMAGRPVEERSILIPPTRVVTRQSTDTLAIENAELAAAVAYIRQNATAGPIGVSDVLRHVPMSRRSLERQFDEILRRTPAEEIRRVRLQKAQSLLIDTDLPIPRVAAACGYGSPEYMSTAFKAAVGASPLQYRSRLRAR